MSVERRSFLKSIGLAGAGLITSSAWAGNRSFLFQEKKFNANFAPHFGMFFNHAGSDELDQLQYIYDAGFRAFEDNGMKNRPIKKQEAIADKMKELGMQMGVFVAHKINWKKPTLTTGDKSHRDSFLKDVEESVEVAKRVNAKWMTVVPGHVDEKLDMETQTQHVIDSLKLASKILEPHGLIMVLEPLNHRDHPGMFLTSTPQVLDVCEKVNSPSCKILFDIYHQQITEGDLIPNINKAWDHIAYFQIGDNPGRREPTTGEINFRNVFQHIYDKGYRGILGMEHGKSMGGKEGEVALMKAYRAVDVNTD